MIYYILGFSVSPRSTGTFLFPFETDGYRNRWLHLSLRPQAVSKGTNDYQGSPIAMLQDAMRGGFRGLSCYTILDVATARGSVPNVALYGVAQWKGQPDMLSSVLVFVPKESETWSFYQFHFS